jgi:hypothetical protein
MLLRVSKAAAFKKRVCRLGKSVGKSKLLSKMMSWACWGYQSYVVLEVTTPAPEHARSRCGSLGCPQRGS